MINILANPILVLFYVSIITGPYHGYQQKEEKCSNWKRYQNSEEKWRNNLKILIQVISNMEKLVLTALIGKVELGKDPKKNLSVASFYFLFPSYSVPNCDHNYLLINILMSAKPVSIHCWGLTVKKLKEERKSNTSFTF